MNLESDLEIVIKDRIADRVPIAWLFKRGVKRAYVAGNCLNRESPHDIDLFPVFSYDFDSIKEVNAPGLLARTKNADTFLADNGTKVQFCWYEHRALEYLVQSFDFAHIQIGARIEIKDENYVEVIQIYYTDDWVKSHAMESTWYTHSEYPLSSLMRLTKYAKRDQFPGRAYIPSIINILMDIIHRGYKDYDDFKDQLDAVDLGLVEKDLRGCDLRGLFEMLKK